METVKKEKSNKVYIPLILIIALVLGGVIYWYIDYSKYIKPMMLTLNPTMLA